MGSFQREGGEFLGEVFEGLIKNLTRLEGFCKV